MSYLFTTFLFWINYKFLYYYFNPPKTQFFKRFVSLWTVGPLDIFWVFKLILRWIENSTNNYSYGTLTWRSMILWFVGSYKCWRYSCEIVWNRCENDAKFIEWMMPNLCNNEFVMVVCFCFVLFCFSPEGSIISLYLLSL